MRPVANIGVNEEHFRANLLGAADGFDEWVRDLDGNVHGFVWFRRIENDGKLRQTLHGAQE